jgi:putative hemolysin
VDELIGFEWPEGRYETLAGFIVAQLGRFPEVGEVIRVGDTTFEVLSMDGRRIDQVRATRDTESEKESG